MSFGKFRNWEIFTCKHFPISQIVLSQTGWDHLGNWEIRRFVYKQRVVNKHGLRAPIDFPMLNPYLFINAGCVCKHGFGARIVTQNVIINVKANPHTDTTVLLILVLKSMLTLISAMMLLSFLPILLQKGIVILTLTGILDFIQVWMFLM